MSRRRRGLMSLLLGGLILAPAQAMAAEIPFFATNNAAVDMCVACSGPWFRSSPEATVSAGAHRDNFYSAAINIFSPYGQWGCDANFIREGFCTFNESSADFIEFCVTDIPGTGAFVDLTITQDNGHVRLGVNYPGTPPCASVAVTAFLGDASSSERDRDVFRFDGEAGGGGEIARLILREDEGRRLDADTGALPLELTATLPAAGSYAVEAHEVGRAAGADSAFLGHYRLRVESDAGENRGESLLLEPTGLTEP